MYKHYLGHTEEIIRPIPRTNTNNVWKERLSIWVNVVSNVAELLSMISLGTHINDRPFPDKNVVLLESGIGGKSPPVTEPWLTTENRFRPWLIIAIRNLPDTLNNRHKPNRTVSGAIKITNGL